MLLAGEGFCCSLAAGLLASHSMACILMLFVVTEKRYLLVRSHISGFITDNPQIAKDVPICVFHIWIALEVEEELIKPIPTIFGVSFCLCP